MHAALQPERHLWRDEIRATVSLAVPLVLTNVAQALIHATDVILLGWLSARTLAAGTLGINLYTAFLIFGLGFVSAASPMIARELGRKAHSVRDVRRTVRQTMWATLAAAVPIWIILAYTETILIAFGQEPELARNAATLVGPLKWGLLPFLLYVVLRNFLAALEQPKWSLLVGTAAVCLNAIVNYGLIFGKFGLPALGLFGAGLGSSLSNLFMFVSMVLVVSLHPRFRRYRLFGNFWRADWPRFREVCALGLPIGITMALEVTIFNAAVFLMGLIGASSIAAHAIAIQIAALTFMVPLGLAQAVTVRVGLAYGRKDKDGIARAGWTSFALGVGFMTLTGIVMIAIPETLASAFLDASDPANREVIRLAVSFLIVAALFQIVDGAQVVGAGMLRGLHDTKVPMIYAALGYWVVGLGTAIALAFWAGWEGVGIWTGLAAGLAAVSVLMVGRWMRREKIGLVGW
ncbi:MATE family efflux transporter [Allosphingosinicella vermicomposti]|uniref:MATE family efflux transporter n=1 Tax=Allosphingosinicella vermicomposti TaxID=614671 RepID=UPI000D10564C|nr:MATE family efflux transporter [Allosphingosinicella vermicomposti]